MEKENRLMIKLALAIPPQNPIRNRHDRRRFERLMAHLAEHGQTSPIQVFMGPDGEYIVYAGWTRCLAARELGWIEIWAIILDKAPTITVARRLEFQDNHNHSPLDPFDLGAYFHQEVASRKITQAQLAEELGVTESFVSRAIAIFLKAVPEAVQLMNEGKLPVSVVGLISRLAPDKQREVAAIAAEKRMKRDAVEKLIRSLKTKPGPKSRIIAGKTGTLHYRFDKADPSVMLKEAERLCKTINRIIRLKLSVTNLRDLLDDRDEPKPIQPADDETVFPPADPTFHDFDDEADDQLGAPVTV
ncbi:MAG: ParB N-terminal domain-containing protein [Paludisphaera borealis]|uniref:ParB/RepB/Spo0J family partition protein n=1 Tax=Paludisphaera borealis TaxID=1387353 RepID=UPI0028507E29|nr:ParB N-terminal domain-containing protein [Paludisphaera borealis]MDR3620477.1 ParB N-terminal domain-containing protein [Paludisphaera borealis]